VQAGDHQDDHDIGKEKTGYRDQQIGDQGGGFVIEAVSMDGRSNPHREREGPGQQSAHDKQGQAVQESLPYLSQHRQVVTPGDDPAGEQIFIEQQVLDMQGFVQVELLARMRSTISGVNLGLSGSIWLGSPGAKWMIRKEITETKKRVTIFLNRASSKIRQHERVSLSLQPQRMVDRTV
jgi:hypothetical protein